MTLTPPLILVADDEGGVELFEDLEQLAISMEGIDVEDGNYQAFDAVGRVIELVAEGGVRTRFTVDIGIVRAELASPEVSHPGSLAEHLQRHLRWVGEKSSTELPPDEANLDELVAHCSALRHRKKHR